jgi:hypothetical protein
VAVVRNLAERVERTTVFPRAWAALRLSRKHPAVFAMATPLRKDDLAGEGFSITDQIGDFVEGTYRPNADMGRKIVRAAK